MKKDDFLLDISSLELLSGVVRDVCEAIDSPRSLTVWLLFREKEYSQLLDLKIVAEHYLTSYRFSDDYLVTSFLSKYPAFNGLRNTKEAAIEAFNSSEDQCKVTNEEISQRLQANARFREIFFSAAEKCNAWLPDLSPSLMQEIVDGMGWGPGVTSAAKGNWLAAYNKFQASLDCTTNLKIAGVHRLVSSIPMWSTYHGSGNPEHPCSVTPDSLTVVPGNVITTVPKNSKTDRTIAVEPHLNAYFQRGIGRKLRSILRRKGCDLRSQERNQHLAKVGSVDGSLATLDLKGASDTIAQKLLVELLPADWMYLLDTARSPMYSLNGEWRRYHKHSSMGNGYTFELETLVFYVLSLSVCEYLDLPVDNVSVYGDDIIVPTEAYELLTEVLSLCGFSVNEKKSFSAGPFRESCGKDYFRGFNVRPFLLKEELLSVQSVYRLANQIRRYAAMREGGYGMDGRFRKVWTNVYLSVAKKFRLRIPDGYGDGGFIATSDELLSSNSVKFSNGAFGPQWTCSMWVFSAKSRPKVDGCLSVASTLMDLEKMPDKHLLDDPDSPMDRSACSARDMGEWRKVSSHFHDWTCRGGWIA